VAGRTPEQAAVLHGLLAGTGSGLQRNLDLQADVGAGPGWRATSPSQEPAAQDVRIDPEPNGEGATLSWASESTLLRGPGGIVFGSPARVGQDRVGLGYRLEPFFGVRLGRAVGMIAPSESMERVRDRFCAGISRNPEDLVIVTVPDW
jgi:hypothetical protein